MSEQTIKVEIIQRDGYSKIGVLKLNQKTIQVPCYGIKYRTKKDLDLFTDSDFPKDYIGVSCFDIFDAKKLIGDYENNNNSTKQQNLFGNIIEDNYSMLSKKMIKIVDPATEYIYFQNELKRNQYQELDLIPKEIINALKNSNTKTHKSYWENELYPNRGTIVDWYVSYQSLMNADVIIPPTPLIDGSLELLSYAKDINKLTTLYAEARHKISSLYFLLHGKVLKDHFTQCMDILTFLNDNEEVKNTKIIFLKIKGIDLHKDVDARHNLKQFLEGLSFVCESTGRFVFIIDSNSFGLISIAKGINGFIEPMNWNTEDQYGTPNESSHLGNYYDPYRLTIRSFNSVKDYQKYNGTLPCSCSACLKMNKADLNGVSPSVWNKFRRLHLLEARNIELHGIHSMIKNKQSRMFFDKVSKSELKNYVDIFD